jgi:hypothetical protein
MKEDKVGTINEDESKKKKKPNQTKPTAKPIAKPKLYSAYPVPEAWDLQMRCH